MFVMARIKLGYSAVQTVFQEVFLGRLQAWEASILLHRVCNQKRMNPSVEKPITMLMLTENGRRQLQFYEDFIMKLNWLVAKLAVQAVAIEEALQQFQMELEMGEELGLIPREDEINSGRECPICGK